MMKIVLVFSILMQLASLAYAESLGEAKVLYKSTSERTVALDVGDLQDFKEGDYGKIFIQRGDLDRPTLFLIGKGKIVKSFPNKSIWLMEKNYITNKMVVDDPVLIMTDRKITVGRESEFKQKHIVFSDKDYDNVDEFLENNNNVVPKKYIAYQDDFEKSDEIFNESKNEDRKIEVTTYSTFKSNGSPRVVDEYNEEIKSLTYLINNKFKVGDLKKAEDLKILESDAAGIIAKYNSQVLPLRNGLYRKHVKTPASKDINDSITLTNAYEIAKEEEKEHNKIDPKVIAKLKRDGEMWSGDMDDDTLRRYFISTGLLKEKVRRQISMNELDGHEVMISYASNANTHVVDPNVDPSFQMYGYHLTLAYDLHLSRTSFNMKNTSIQFLMERGLGYYNLSDTINGRSEEGTYGAYVNYYFINNPLTLNSFIWSLGTGIKFGMAQVGADSLVQRYDYQVLTLPTFQLLTKYRFRSGDLTENTLNVGMSFNVGLIYELKNLRIVNNPTDNIYSRISASDIKYQFGFSFYF